MQLPRTAVTVICVRQWKPDGPLSPEQVAAQMVAILTEGLAPR